MCPALVQAAPAECLCTQVTFTRSADGSRSHETRSAETLGHVGGSAGASRPRATPAR